MSNLSELLPAGSGAKVAEFVASGTLASGQTVVLKADGTVEAVGLTPAGLGAETTFDSATSLEGYFSSTYDSVNNKIVIAGRVSAQSFKGYAYVGTISGTSITFGTPVQFTSGTDRANGSVAITYDVASGNVVIYWSNIDSSNYATAIVGTVSGTSISFGSPVVFDSSSVSFATANTNSATYHSGQDVCVLSYNNSAGTLSTIACSVSGTTPTFGTKVTPGGTAFESIDNVYDVSADRIVTSGKLAGTGMIVLSSCSGTAMTTRAVDQQFNSGTNYTALAYDPINEKTIVVYADTSNGTKGSARVCTVSASGVSFGTEVVFQASGTSEWISAAYDASAQKIVVASSSAANSDSGQIYVGTVSGTDISFSGQLAFNGTSTTIRIRATYATTAKQTCISYVDYGNTQRGSAILYSNIGTNSADFLGITNAAISNSATGEVGVQGGVPSSNAGASVPFALSLGSEAVFESASTSHIAPVYDTNAQKVVIAYSDNANGGYGTAVVGTVSGSGITFGTPVIFRSSNTSRSISAAYDANAQKIVVAYSDVGRFSIGYILVGTVSGTSISFGSEASNNVTCNYLSVIYAPDVQKIVVSYQNEDSSFKATSIVGTVSGTSISFGTAALLTAGRANYVSSAYDTTNNRVVVSYQDQNNSYYGTAAVGTISGTSISFGTPVVFEAANSAWVSTTYNTAQQKIVISYQDNGNSNYGTAVVGTVSGTSISFATPVVFEAAEVTYTWAIYDPNSQNIVISYTDNGNSNYGTVVLGTVSGTSISFGTPIVFNAGGTAYAFSVYNTDLQKIVFTYRDDGNSLYGTATVGTLSGGAFTPNTDYYVQTDGTLNTTVTTVPAGRALSATSILLEG